MKSLAVFVFIGATACAKAPPARATPTATATVADAPPVASPPVEEKGLVVDVPESGDVVVAGTPVAEASLRDHFAKRGGEDVAIIRAVDSVSWGRIVLVLDQLRSRPNKGGEFLFAVKGDAKRRTATIHFPRASEIDVPPPEPPPGGAPVPDIQPMLVVTITRDGKRIVGSTVVEGSLREKLRDRGRIVVHADRDVSFGNLVDVVLDAQAVGAKIAFAVSPEPTPLDSRH